MSSFARLAAVGLTAFASTSLVSSFTFAQNQISECPERTSTSQAYFEKFTASQSEAELADLFLQETVEALESKIGKVNPAALSAGYKRYRIDFSVNDLDMEIAKQNMPTATLFASLLATEHLKSGIRQAYDTPTTAVTCVPLSYNRYWIQFECSQDNSTVETRRQDVMKWANAKRSVAQQCMTLWRNEDIANQDRMLREALEIKRVTNDTIQTARQALSEFETADFKFQQCKMKWRYLDRAWISLASKTNAERSGVKLIGDGKAAEKRELCGHVLQRVREDLDKVLIAEKRAEDIRDFAVVTDAQYFSRLLSKCTNEIEACEDGSLATLGGRLIHKWNK